MVKRWLFNTRNIERSSYIWNMAGSMILAFQSVILLMVITRVLGLEAAGVYTIAYANANLFLTIGKYGMRYFQVSDIKEEYSFGEYLSSRWITTVAMIGVSIIYVLILSGRDGYSSEKCYIIVWMCFFKAVDSLEDIYHGMYQQRKRLDVASKILTIRMVVTILFFCICLLITHNLYWSLIASTILTVVLFIMLTFITFDSFKSDYRKINKKNIVNLLIHCFPLFIGGFLSFYIGNAPKYAIDMYLSDEMQACYGFIAMPVFVIGLLNGFIFNPMLYKISLLWHKGKKNAFIKCIIRQCFVVVGITLICVIGGYLIGIPVLSILYSTDLSAYKKELLILLLGGGFLALSGWLNTVITIMRYQYTAIFAYGVVALIALFFSNPFVYRYQVFGAAILYTGLMAILCFIFILLIIFGFLKSAKKFNEKS